MQYYLAPMEGITGYIYRRAQNALFPAFDKYFSPFLAPRPKKTFNSREVKDILPEKVLIQGDGRLKNALDSAFFNQDLRRSVANPVIAAPNWRFGARASA